METNEFDLPIIACLGEIHRKLKEAEKIARAAHACAAAGSISESIKLSMDLQQLAHDVGRLYDAVCVLGRLAAA